MRRQIAHILIAVIVALQSIGLARAGDSFPEYPFLMTSDQESFSIKCDGFWFRTSGCVALNGPNHQEFYRAISNLIFSARGQWSCSAYARPDCTRLVAANLFCILSDTSVNVELGFSDGRLSVNQPTFCRSATAGGVLGQNGEGDETPAHDVDTFRFAGEAGEKVKVTLDRDGSSGSAGRVATLRVHGQGGGVIGQRSGPVPIALDLTLPGPVEIAVLRTPGKPNALRGYYTLEVAPRSGDVGERQLVPAANVEW
jgi:hypothetical protein